MTFVETGVFNLFKTLHSAYVYQEYHMALC